MPNLRTKIKGLRANAKVVLKSLLPVTCYLLLVTILSGCKVVGVNKPAALQVTSVPESSVFLDSKHVGKTPFFSDQLKAGEYTLKVTVSQASYVDKITLTEGTLTVVNRELNNNFLAQSGETLGLKPGKKGILVVSMPDEAELTIDGALKGKTPYLSNDIKEGEHKISLTRDGYVEREFSVKTSSKYQLVADVTLASIAAKESSNSKNTDSQAETNKVEITKSPQGFLRVRSEPALSALEVGQVKTGEKLEVIQEIKDWIKIKFEDKLGWISTQYTKKVS